MKSTLLIYLIMKKLINLKLTKICVFVLSSFCASPDIIYFTFLLLFMLGCLFFLKGTSLVPLLILAEVSWITLYFAALSSALFFDYILCLSLGFFFLMFSAAEISIGLSLLLLSLQLLNSTFVFTFRNKQACST